MDTTNNTPVESSVRFRPPPPFDEQGVSSPPCTKNVTEWTRDDAIALCVSLEQIAPKYGAHVALTGGLLYKLGPRKDVDILFYRIRQVTAIDEDGLIQEIHERLGITINEDGHSDFVLKAVQGQRSIDFFFPEGTDIGSGAGGGIYGEDESEPLSSAGERSGTEAVRSSRETCPPKANL